MCMRNRSCTFISHSEACRIETAHTSKLAKSKLPRSRAKMPTSPKLLAAAAGLFLLSAIHAAPAPEPTPAPAALELRAEPTDAWVSVDKTGLPVTVTPVVTVFDGVPTTISAIPIELTATVLTRTAYGELTTSSGTAAAQPTATNKKGKGAFLACSNVDGDFAPFCEPAKNSTLYTGTTYYGKPLVFITFRRGHPVFCETW